MAPPSIFISYSHKDREWHSQLQEYLGVLRQEGQVSGWSDENLKPGDDWPREIRQALEEAEIAVLLVSHHFLDSKFIMEKELPVILNRWDKGDLKVIPLIVTPCNYELSPLRRIERRPKGNRDSVKGGNDAEQMRDFRDLTTEIANLLVPQTLPAAKPKIIPGVTPKRPHGKDPRVANGIPQSLPSQDVYAVLDIRLSHREWNRYCVELNFTRSGETKDLPLPLTHFAPFDLPRLLNTKDNEEYARQLRKLLFSKPEHTDFLRTAQESASKLNVPLRLRITISPSSRELHWLRWELLMLGSHTENALSFESTTLVRYAAADAGNWRDIQHRPKRRLKALLAAGPTDWFEPSIRQAGSADPALEALERARGILAASDLVNTEVRGYLNRDQLSNEISATAPDILYLCVDLPSTEASAELGNIDVEWWAARLVNLPITEALKGIDTLPRLVILLPVFHGALKTGEWHSGWFSILREAYELAQAGVLGVLTLQAGLEAPVWDAFLGSFIDNFGDEGRMDNALYAARAAIGESGRQWAPVLISCLRTARIWYVPRFTGETMVEATWDTLLRKIWKGECTPVIGPGLNSTIARLRTQIALSWAEDYQYPMAFHERISLPQVAQYVASVWKEDYIYSHYEEKIREIMLQRYGNRLGDDKRKLPLDRFLTEMGVLILGQKETEPHRILAELPFPLYITASLNSFLSDALSRAKRPPQEIILGLSEQSGAPFSFEPTVDNPLVYHLFGHFSDISNSVLTEDDYFDFLIHFWKEKETIPKLIRATLTNSSLIFLGFRMHHWDFRVLFRSLLSQEGSRRRGKHTHVAVQIDPDDDQVVDPERARDYLENYFSDFSGANINVYWGSAEDFLNELKSRYKPPRE